MISIEQLEELRRRIKPLAEQTNDLRHQGSSDPEAVANTTLAYRHLEDASMRLGKAIQALSGGVSIYDRNQVPRT